MIGSSLKSACGRLEEIEMESPFDIGFTFVTLMLGKIERNASGCVVSNGSVKNVTVR